MITDFEVFKFFITNPKVYEKFNTIIKSYPIKFENPSIELFWDWLDFYFGRYRKTPGWGWLYFAVSSHGRLGDTKKQELTDALNYMRANPREIELDLVFQFFWQAEQYRRELAAVRLSWQSWDDELKAQRDFLEFFEVLRDPDTIQNSVCEIIPVFASDQRDKYWDYIMQVAEGSITTGCPVWDSMTGGGYKPGTLNGIHAKTNGGKTLVISDQVINPVLKMSWPRTVLFALDLNTREMIPRLIARVAATPLGEEARINQEIYQHRIDKAIEGVVGIDDRFWLVRQPRGTMTTREMFRIIEDIEARCYEADLARGFSEEDAGLVDVIGVDHINVLRHSSKGHLEETRHKYDNSCISLAGYGESRNKIIIVGCQSNRPGNQAETLTNEYLGEHHGITYHCNMFYSLARSKADKIAGNFRVVMDKVKAADTDFVLHYKVNFKTMSFYFDNTIGVTLIDNTIHPEWERRFPAAAAKAKVQSANPIAGLPEGGLNPRKRKRKVAQEAGLTNSPAPAFTFFGTGVNSDGHTSAYAGGGGMGPLPV